MALEGIRVVERIGRLAGSVCAGRLADLGAELVRVAVDGDPLPNEPAAWRDHPFANPSAEMIRLDRGDPGFGARWQGIADKADIVIVTPEIRENGKAVADFAGINAEQQVICAVSAFGIGAQEPPLADPGEIEMQAIGGSLATTGGTDGAPCIVDLPILELFTGLNAATAALAALRVKEAGGGGQVLDISVFETSFTLTGTFLGNVLSGRTRGFRNGCRHPLVAPWNAYPTSNGWVILCTTSNQNWLDLTQVISRPELAEDPEFATAAARISVVEKVDRVISEWSRTVTTEQALAALQACAIPSGTVATTAEVARAGTPVPCRRMAAPAGPAPRGTAASGPPERPLDGIRVLEVGPYTAGPLAGRFLANLGAEVIKIEGSGGEDSRLWQPFVDGVSCYFANYNAGKKSVVLNLRSKQGEAAFLDLVKTADVVLFNLKAGAMERMGLGARRLHDLNPRLVYCGISGYGMNGSARPALDTVIQAEAGVIDRIASVGGPAKGGVSIADLGAAHLAPLEILAALRKAQNTGRGSVLDISMFDTVAWLGCIGWPDGDPVLPDHCIVQTADGWVVALDSRSELDRQLNGVEPSGQTSAALCAALAEVSVRALPMLELDEVYALDVAKRDGLMVFERADKGGNCVIAAPYALSRTPVAVDTRVAEVGADNLALTGCPPPLK